jgi:unspecific monooxygenase
MLTEPRIAPPTFPLRATELGPFAALSKMRANALELWSRRAYERPAMTGTFFGRTQVMLNDPEAIGHVLVRNVANYRRPSISRRLLLPLVGDGLLLSEGPVWRHQRRTIAPIMAPRSMPVLCRHIARAGAESCARLAQDGPIDLLAEMQHTSLEIAGRSMFSLEMAEHGGPIRDLLNRFVTQLVRPNILEVLLPRFPSPQDAARRKFRHEWMGLIGQIVDARAASADPDRPRDLFDMLIAARDPETGQAFTRTQLCDQVATMILAGHATTALTLFWSLNLLAQSPLWQDRVAGEALANPFGPEDAAEVLPRLATAKAVVSEALRLYPPAFMVTREPIERDVANGIVIPQGCTVIIAPWVLHRHAKLWEDPPAFDPGRFMPDAPPPPRFAYLPFGAGPRICVGAQFAMAEAVLVLAALLATFRVTAPDAAKVRPIGMVTTQPDRAIAFRFERRD